MTEGLIMPVVSWVQKMTVAERVSMAKERMLRVVDHAHYLLKLHENNAIVVYSPTLSKQIPTSFAANAFNVFQQGMHQIEIVRLCALWDTAEPEKENVPSVIELIDHPGVIDFLAEETASQWQRQGGALLNSPDDPELAKLAEQALARSNEEFGQRQAQKARDELGKAIADSRAVLASQKHVSIMNLRDKHLAHSLSETRKEKKVGPVRPVKYGDEREMLETTLPIIQALYCWVNGTSLSFDDSREINRKNARALWEACTFNIVR